MDMNQAQPNYVPVAVWAAADFVREWNARPVLVRWLMGALLGFHGRFELQGLTNALRTCDLDPETLPRRL